MDERNANKLSLKSSPFKNTATYFPLARGALLFVFRFFDFPFFFPGCTEKPV